MKTLGKLLAPLLLIGLFFAARAWYFTPSVGGESAAIDFTAQRLDGTHFQLSDLRGRYVLLDFWASWCAPCRRESPALAALARDFPGRLAIVSVAIEKDSLAWRRALAQDHREWPHQVMDETTSFKFLSGKISSLYGVNRVPTLFFIGPGGQVQWVDEGASAVARVREYLSR